MLTGATVPVKQCQKTSETGKEDRSFRGTSRLERNHPRERDRFCRFFPPGFRFRSAIVRMAWRCVFYYYYCYFFWEKERERKRVRFQGMIMVSHLLLEIFAPAGHFDRYRVEPLDLASKSLSVASGTLYLHRIIRLFFLDYRIFLDLLCMIFIFVLLKRSNGYEKNHVINIETVYPYIYICIYISFKIKGN